MSSGGRSCFNCGAPGHFARDCPTGGGDGAVVAAAVVAAAAVAAAAVVARATTADR
jgi:hypothetical protein